MDKTIEDLLKLFSWSSDWLMMFNIDKCKLMYIGNSNGNGCYVVGEVKHGRRLMKKETWEFIMSSDLNV